MQFARSPNLEYFDPMQRTMPLLQTGGVIYAKQDLDTGKTMCVCDGGMSHQNSVLN
jgi:hypothetical protein